jgi:hypothetical protein
MMFVLVLYLHLQFVGSFLGCLLKVGLPME